MHDKLILGLIRNYLEAGIMLSSSARKVHPKVATLSPLLVNILLDDVWKGMEIKSSAMQMHVRHVESIMRCMSYLTVDTCYTKDDNWPLEIDDQMLA